MELQNLAELAPTRLQTVATDVEPLVHLRDVYTWCSSRPTPVAPLLTVSYPDLNQDVVIPYPDSLYLVFGLT